LDSKICTLVNMYVTFYDEVLIYAVCVHLYFTER